MSFSDNLENKLLNHTFGSTAMSAPSARYVALYTTDPTDASGASNEVTGNGYVRQTISFGDAAAVSGVMTISNDGDVTFPAATGSTWGTIVAVGIFDHATSSTSANYLAHSGLNTDKLVSVGDIFKIPAGDLDITLT